MTSDELKQLIIKECGPIVPPRFIVFVATMYNHENGEMVVDVGLGVKYHPGDDEYIWECVGRGTSIQSAAKNAVKQAEAARKIWER